MPDFTLFYRITFSNEIKPNFLYKSAGNKQIELPTNATPLSRVAAVRGVVGESHLSSCCRSLSRGKESPLECKRLNEVHEM